MAIIVLLKYIIGIPYTTHITEMFWKLKSYRTFTKQTTKSLYKKSICHFAKIQRENVMALKMWHFLGWNFNKTKMALGVKDDFQWLKNNTF